MTTSPIAGPLVPTIESAPESALETLWAYFRISQALYEEAALLDARQYEAWLAMVTEDVVYQVPLIRNQSIDTMELAVSDGMLAIDDTYRTLKLRVDRHQTGFAWAEDPPSRIRRFVTNIRIVGHPAPQEYAVDSDLLLTRNRDWEPHSDLLAALRHDVWRWEAPRWKLARRRVILDQAEIGTRNLGIFL
jgi:ethylbenzene dioxygenase beta subunit